MPGGGQQLRYLHCSVTSKIRLASRLQLLGWNGCVPERAQLPRVCAPGGKARSPTTSGATRFSFITRELSGTATSHWRRIVGAQLASRSMPSRGWRGRRRRPVPRPASRNRSAFTSPRSARQAHPGDSSRVRAEVTSAPDRTNADRRGGIDPMISATWRCLPHFAIGAFAQLEHGHAGDKLAGWDDALPGGS